MHACTRVGVVAHQRPILCIGGIDDMGSNRATDQVHDDSQTLGKYPIRVRVRVRVRGRGRVRVRVRV